MTFGVGDLRKSNVFLAQQHKCLKCGLVSLASSHAEVKESKNKFFLHLTLHSHTERAQHAFVELNWTNGTLGQNPSEEIFGSQLAAWMGGISTELRPRHLPDPRHRPPSGCQFHIWECGWGESFLRLRPACSCDRWLIRTPVVRRLRLGGPVLSFSPGQSWRGQPSAST